MKANPAQSEAQRLKDRMSYVVISRYTLESLQTDVSSILSEYDYRPVGGPTFTNGNWNQAITTL